MTLVPASMALAVLPELGRFSGSDGPANGLVQRSNGTSPETFSGPNIGEGALGFARGSIDYGRLWLEHLGGPDALIYFADRVTIHPPTPALRGTAGKLTARFEVNYNFPEQGGAWTFFALFPQQQERRGRFFNPANNAFVNQTLLFRTAETRVIETRDLPFVFGEPFVLEGSQMTLVAGPPFLEGRVGFKWLGFGSVTDTEGGAVGDYTVESATGIDWSDGSRVFWRQANDGSFRSGANWFFGDVPASEQDAVFDRDGAYTVVDVAGQVRRLEVRQGDVRLVGATLETVSQEATKGGIVIGDGAGNRGKLTVTGGTLVGNSVDIARGDASTRGTLVLDGAASALTAQKLYVGRFGVGRLEMTGGTRLDAPRDLRVGDSASADGTLVASGMDTKIDAGFVFVGQGGRGLVQLANAAKTTSHGVSIGSLINSDGRVSVSGEGSLWRDDITVLIGDQGRGRLEVSNRAVFRGTHSVMGFDPLGQGELVVRGTGSLFLLTGSGGGQGIVLDPDNRLTHAIDRGGNGDGVLLAGNKGAASITIEDGGQFRVSGMSLGAGNNSSATMKVSGSGSSAFAGALWVGERGYGELTVEAGGALETGGDLLVGAVGDRRASPVGLVNASAIIRSGGQVTVRDEVRVGDHGQALVVVESGGFVSSRTIRLSEPVSGVGHLLISGQGSGWSANGKLEMDRGSLQVLGGGRLETQGGKVVVPGLNDLASVVVSGDGSQWNLGINDLQLGGLLNGSATGRVDLAIEHGAQLLARDVLVGSNARVHGVNGTFSANLINRGGVIAPGSSPGRLKVDGDFIQQEGVLQMEVGGRVPGVEHDVLDVSGDLVLGGTLELAFVSGFAPKAGESFSLFEVEGATVGSFASVAITGLMPGFEYRLNPLEGTLLALNDAVAVPEPASSVAILLAGAALAGRGRRAVQRK